MLRLMKYLKNYVKESILAPLFKMLEAGLELIVPLVITQIIDVGIANGDKPYIYKMGFALLALGIVGLISSVTAQYFAAKAAIGFGTELRNSLFSHINSLSFKEIDSIGTSTLITRITNDVNQLQTGVNMALRLFLRSPFIVFGSMIMAFTIDVKAALVFFVAIPLLFAVVFGVMFASVPVYKKVQAKLDKITLMTRENLSGVRVIRAFNRQKQEIKDFDDSCGELTRLQIFVGRISALLNPVTYVMLNLAIIAIIWIGGKEVYVGTLTQGLVVALVNYMSQILVELIKLSNLVVTTNKALACANRIASVMEVESDMEYGKESGKKDESTAVEFKNVEFKYSGSKEPSLESVSFSVKRGQTVGIIGSTGSGKSTLINLIPRLYDCTDGEIELFGRNIKEYSQQELIDLVAVVPQKVALFKDTLRGNLLWGNENASDEEMLEAMRLAQGYDIIEAKGEGLDFEVEQDGKNLSGGQRQRISIARALVKKADILILDDSTSALDFATDARLRKALKESLGGSTVFIVSQRVSSVENSDVIFVMDDGRLAGVGTHKELYETCEVYKEICVSQLSQEEGGANE